MKSIVFLSLVLIGFSSLVMAGFPSIHAILEKVEAQGYNCKNDEDRFDYQIHGMRWEKNLFTFIDTQCTRGTLNYNVTIELMNNKLKTIEFVELKPQ